MNDHPKVCGRCGEHTTNDKGEPITQTFPITTPGGATFKICLTCAKSFDHWMHTWLSDAGRSVPEFSDPWRHVDVPS